MDFFKKIGKKDDKKNENTPKPKQHPNPLQQFQNIFQPKEQQKSNNFRGGGVALGTTNKLPPGCKIVSITLKQNTEEAVGIFVEKNEKNSAIVSRVVPDSPGDKAGFIRGDIICFPGSEGMEEMNYDQFVVMLKERTMHDLHFEVRRVVAMEAGDGGRSADAYVKRQAVIAAAEERNKKNKPKNISKAKDTKKITNNIASNTTSSVPMSEQSKKAVEAAKASEAMDVQNLGFNPYETTAVTAGQAKKTVVDVIHGEINNTGISSVNNTAPPSSNIENNSGSISRPLIQPSIYEPFDTSFQIYLSSNSNTASLTILIKLITNALTKPDDKFRRVRLSNAKIQSNIVDVQGAVDVMITFGFIPLEEEDGETCLVYDCDGVEEEGEVWKIQALEYMKQCL